MAIAFGTFKNVSGSATASLTLTSVAIGSTADRVLLVRTCLLTDQTRQVSSVVFNGSESFTFIRRDNYNLTNFNWRQELWYRVNPSNVTASVVVTFNGTTSSTTLASLLAYTGVDQTTPIPHTNSGGTAGGTTLGLAVTSATDNLVASFWTALTGANAASSTGTERYNVNSGNRRIVGADQAAGASTTTPVFTATSGDDKLGYVLHLAAAGAAAGGGAVRLAGPGFRLAGSPGGVAG